MRAKSFLYLGVFILAAALPSSPAGAQALTYLGQWGTYGSGIGQFNHPVGVAINGAGEVFVADQGNHRIQKFSSTGAYLMQWELAGGDGYYDLPEGLATDAAGNLYVADSGLNRVQKFNGEGGYLTEWHRSTDPAFGWSLAFLRPFGVAVDASGDVYVTNPGYGYVQKFTADGAHLVDKWVGGNPAGVATDQAGNVYLASSDNTVQKFTSGLVYLSNWGSSGTGSGQFDQPKGVATDADGNVYVVDSSNNRIQKFSAAGEYVGAWGSSGSGDGQFNLPMGVAVNAAGEVFVTDAGNSRIQKFGLMPTPTATKSFGALKAKYR